MEILEQSIPYIGVSLYQIMFFIISLVLGIIVVKILVRIVEKTMEKARVPDLVAGLVTGITKAIGYIVVVLSVLPIVGINTSTVGLGLSAILGLILGFGLQDTWANMAAGVWLAVIKPFNKGDYIDVAGYSGVVKGIGIMSTELRTWDNTVITIPNKNVWGASIVNYTREPVRRVTIDVGVAYGTALDQAIAVALDIIKNHPKVLDDPQPQVVVTELGNSSINLQLRAWVKKEDYGVVKTELIKKIYEEFSKAGIEIPFPQLDIHIRDMPNHKL